MNNGARLCASARLCRGSPVCQRDKIVKLFHCQHKRLSLDLIGDESTLVQVISGNGLVMTLSEPMLTKIHVAN